MVCGQRQEMSAFAGAWDGGGGLFCVSRRRSDPYCAASSCPFFRIFGTI